MTHEVYDEFGRSDDCNLKRKKKLMDIMTGRGEAT